MTLRHTPNRRMRVLAAAFLAVSVSACTDDSSVVEPVDEPPFDVAASVANRSHVRQILKIFAANARYHSTRQAAKAGYEESHECVAVPGLGGMGFHWVNEGLVDPVVEPLKPEAVLYEPGPNGKLRLVAVEYVVLDVGQEHPTLAGQPFDVGGTPLPVPHYSLHLWIYKYNPNGLFTPFNPRVSCPA